MAKELEIKHIFDPERMQMLVKGREALRNKESTSLDFIYDAVADLGEFTRTDMLLGSVKPITAAALLYAEYSVDSNYRQLKTLWGEAILDQPEYHNDFVYVFRVLAHLGVWGSDLKKILRIFNTFCKTEIREHLPYMAETSLISLNALYEEIMDLDLEENRFYLDLHSPIRQVVIPPLSKEDIVRLTDMAESLLACDEARYLTHSSNELLKVMRFYKCTVLGVQGYEHIQKEAAVALLQKSVPMFEIKSAYLIVDRFNALCREGLGSAAIAHFCSYPKILLRPLSYGGTSLSHNIIETYIDFISSPSRLAYGISEAILHGGHYDVLDLFLSDEHAGMAVNTRPFIKDLTHLLRKYPEHLRNVIDIYSRHHSRHTSFARKLAKELSGNPSSAHSKVDTDFKMAIPENCIVRRALKDEWILYYDDRSFVYQAAQEPEDMEDVQMLHIGYGHDLEIAKIALQNDPSVLTYVAPKLRDHPEIRKILQNLKEN